MRFAASVSAQLALGRLTHPKVLAVGTVLFPIGLALTAVSLYQPTLWLFLTAAAPELQIRRQAQYVTVQWQIRVPV